MKLRCNASHGGRSHQGKSCQTFELSGHNRQDAKLGLAKMYRVPADRAWRPAVGAPLEPGVGGVNADTLLVAALGRAQLGRNSSPYFVAIALDSSDALRVGLPVSSPVASATIASNTPPGELMMI